MLFYLDNWMSADPNGPHMDLSRPGNARGRFGRTAAFPAPPKPQQGKNAPKGLNENYGRELMELHTLGVDGGYTQKDVTEVARAFTGWTIENPRQGSGFKFGRACTTPARRRSSVIASSRVGIQDGEQVLDILQASVDRAVHLDEAGAPVRERHASGVPRRSRRRAVPRL